MTALGRQETWEDSPEVTQTPTYTVVDWHDNYEAEASPDRSGSRVSGDGEAASEGATQRAKAS